MKFATVLTTAVLAIAPFSAHATPPTEDYSSAVRYADLNLDSQAGIVTLYHRIKNAAQVVCDQQAHERLVPKQSFRVCVDRAVSEAVVRMDRPMLTNYVAQRTGKKVDGSRQVAGR